MPRLFPTLSHFQTSKTIHLCTLGSWNILCIPDAWKVEPLKTAKGLEETDTYPKATPSLLCKLVHVTLSIWALGSSIFRRWDWGACLYVVVCRPRRDIWASFSVSLHLILLRQDLSLNLDLIIFVQLSWLPKWSLVIFPSPLLPCAVLTDRHVDTGDSILGVHVCTVSTLTTLSHLQSS